MEAIPLALPWVGEEEAAAAAEVVKSGWLTSGPRVAEFEQQLAAELGASATVAVSNGTTAIELALRVVGVRPGDVVVTVSHSFVATANAIRACGAEPVFVDIDPRTRNLCPERLAELFENDFDTAVPPRYRAVSEIAVPPSPLADAAQPSGRLGAILVVHQIGMPADLESIASLAEARGVPIVEDAACALGSRVVIGGEEEPIGRPRGSVATFSFHPRKVITTGEGGALSFADERLAQRARLLRNHGLELGDDGSRRYVRAGFNFRMSDIAAAVGCVQLRKLGKIVSARRRLAERYTRGLDELPGVTPPVEPADARSNYQSYICELKQGIDQTAVIEQLAREKIATQPGIMCAHLEPAYSRPLRAKLPRSEHAMACGLTLPLFAQMSDEQVDRVIEALGRAVGG